MFDEEEVFYRLEELETHWNEMCKKIESTEMSRDDARLWYSKFEQSLLLFKTSIPRWITKRYANEIYPRLDMVRDKVDVAILKSKANYREKEKIRLKDSYGFLGGIFYVLFKILRKI